MEELFVIIPKLPGVRVYQFSDAFESSKSLCDFCQEQGHYLEIVALEDAIYEEIKDLPAKVRRIDEDKERYNLRSMQFDTIFVNYDITKLQDPEQFLRKTYRMMKNAADLLLFLDKAKIEEFTKLLEELNYVAINPISYSKGSVLSAKKMHGWAKV
ncbi:hypothetical protein [Nitratiruptor tergarcus]|uniref:Uncharacterized protein n=1 Tax=Nitratiruptor tergarcus DSM 16512 TaxID=1069081 RepID=A0A1W1WR08_9BACT|nr:hypothetical protein [Nitratiruptor tergarcus]SMC08744.1 hypothetical protein SAMN05660197_0510 [Nitratiruptor tergarcus DSM 16512]